MLLGRWWQCQQVFRQVLRSGMDRWRLAINNDGHASLGQRPPIPTALGPSNGSGGGRTLVSHGLGWLSTNKLRAVLNACTRPERSHPLLQLRQDTTPRRRSRNAKERNSLTLEDGGCGAVGEAVRGRPRLSVPGGLKRSG